MPRRLPLVVAVLPLAAGCSSTSGGSPTTLLTAVTFVTAVQHHGGRVRRLAPAQQSRDVDRGDHVALPATSSAGTTTVTPATTGGASSTTIARLPTTAPTAAFTPVPGPDVPDVTHPVEAAWVDPASQELLSVDDGDWATVTGVCTADGGERFVTFRLAQAFFGDACTARFRAD